LRSASLSSSTGYAVAAIARNLGLYAVALTSVPMCARWSGWAPLAVAPLIGLAYYRLTLVMHDCIHATLLPIPRTNRTLGIIFGALCGIEFHAFSRLHWQHHRVVGQSDDPQGADYLVAWSAGPGTLIIHLLRPLAGVTLFKLRQIFASLEHLDQQGRLQRWSALALVIGAQSAVAVAVSDGLRLWWLAPLPIASAATFGLFFAQFRGFAEHVAMPGVAAAGFVRSHRTTFFGRLLLYDLNFNFHQEHHLYPGMPSCHLPELHRQLVETGEVGALASGMLATVRDRLCAAALNTSRRAIST
jgi:fatty acid desaturase